jgi:sugar lactone lactonase YvrE
MQLTVVAVPPLMLGECPVWNSASGALFFIDCRAPKLFAHDPAAATLKEWPLPALPGSFALDDAGGAILAMAQGFARLDLASGALAMLAEPEAARPDHRFNDGAADAAGCFWAGSMHRSYREPTGSIWRLDRAGAARAVLSGLRVPNGLAWSPDDTRFYFSDSPRAMFVAEHDPGTGRVSPPWVFAAADAAPGWPDGVAIDRDGFLWNARWDGGGIARFAPDGRLDRFVPLPVSRPTSCAFGGAGLDRLFVTSARIGLDAAALAREPLAGALFIIDLGASGVAKHRYSPHGS